MLTRPMVTTVGILRFFSRNNQNNHKNGLLPLDMITTHRNGRDYYGSPNISLAKNDSKPLFKEPLHHVPSDAVENNNNNHNLDVVTDTTSQISVPSYHHYQTVDLDISILSNTIFLLAGSFYLFVAVWDFRPPTEDSFGADLYNILSDAAPFTYLANSCIDIVLADRIRLRQKQQKQQLLLDQYSGAASVVVASSMTTAAATTTTTGLNFEEYNHNSYNNCKEQETNVPKKATAKHGWNRIRKHAAHRRDLYAALTFFGAALAGSAGVLLAHRHDGAIISDGVLVFLDSLSIHLYMVSAIFALVGSRVLSLPQPGFQFRLPDVKKQAKNADALEDAGDVFFLTGSIVDVILCDFHFDDNIVWWPILSALLWVLDALFYLRSDQITLDKVLKEAKQQQQNKNSSNDFQFIDDSRL